MALKGLADRVVLVTGGASGIGRGTAARLLEEGARVAIADVSEAAIEQALEELGRHRVLAVRADITLEADVVRAFSEVEAALGPVEALHNNAGIEGAIMALTDVELDEFDRVVAVNLRGAFLVLREMLRRTVKRGGPATIVNTASGTGLHGIPNIGVYAATKAGLISLTRTAAREHAANGVRVNAIVPGPVATALFNALPDEFQRGVTANVPLGRAGTVEEVAALAAWLLSDESPYVTGALYAVDGGETS
jgi:NAD(P)-dependent dehydrogenase (short-subunit alcohol dehydrogenase family)